MRVIKSRKVGEKAKAVIGGIAAHEKQSMCSSK